MGIYNFNQPKNETRQVFVFYFGRKRYMCLMVNEIQHKKCMAEKQRVHIFKVKSTPDEAI